MTIVQNYDRRFPAREEQLQKRRETLSRLIQETILDGIRSGEFRGIDARIGAELFRGMMRAAGLLRREEDTLDALVREMVGIFVHGIARGEK